MMSKSPITRFKRHSFGIEVLVKALEDAGLVWGRHFELTSFPQPDTFELSFRNDALAARALVLWTARTMPPVKKVRPKRKKGRTSPLKSANAGKPVAGRLIVDSKRPRQQAKNAMREPSSKGAGTFSA